MESLTRRARYLLATLSSGETLLMHLGMSGWFCVDPLDAVGIDVRDDRCARVGAARPRRVPPVVPRRVTFNDPRRCGFMDLLTPGGLVRHKVLRRLGPERCPRRSMPRPSRGRVKEEGTAQGRAARPASGGRPRQHLRERGAPRGGCLAVPEGVDDRDTGGRAARRRTPARRRHQAGPDAGDRSPRDHRLSIVEVSRLRPRG